MTTKARCDRCIHDHGRYQLCLIAGRVAGGGYVRTCEHFVPRQDLPTVPAKSPRPGRRQRPPRRARQTQPHPGPDPFALLEIRPTAGRHFEIGIRDEVLDTDAPRVFALIDQTISTLSEMARSAGIGLPRDDDTSADCSTPEHSRNPR